MSQSMEFDENLLPAIIEINAFHGDWERYEDHLYGIFLKDFVYSKPLLIKKPVQYRRNPEINGKIQTFFHITSENTSHAVDPNDRTPDFRRCERVPWIREIIDQYEQQTGCCSFVKIWAEEWKNYIRWHLLIPEVRFLIVVEERENYNLLITSFYLEKDHQLKKKLKKFEKYQKQKTPL
ncbi:hypothetical protein [Bacillus subtilis]|uniref:hypothetical protein n=1 Tax=Bacillus subtilis TaxID=1423 RepID=UPI0040335389